MEAYGSRWNNSAVTECFRSIWTLMKVCGSSWRGWESVNSYASYWSSMKPVQVGGGIPRYIETRESIHRIWSWKLQLMVVVHPVPPIVELVFYFYLLPLKLEASRHFHASDASMEASSFHLISLLFSYYFHGNLYLHYL